MSEIRDYKPLSLGESEQMFIILFSQAYSYSAWGLWEQMKITKPMSYPNVLKKIKRLVELGVLEAIEGKFKRRAIKYKLTTRGLFERLALTGWYAIHPLIWYNYRDNIILQTILYRFFETQTIWKFREAGHITVSTLITDYLRKCCEGLLSLAKSNPKLNEHDIEQLLITELRDLILKIVIMSSIDEINWEEKRKTSPNQKSYMALRGDKKFSPHLLELREISDRGYKRFGIAPYPKS